MVLLYKVLSAHAPNEEYLNNDQPEWIAVRLRTPPPPLQCMQNGTMGQPGADRMHHQLQEPLDWGTQDPPALAGCPSLMTH